MLSRSRKLAAVLVAAAVGGPTGFAIAQSNDGESAGSKCPTEGAREYLEANLDELAARSPGCPQVLESIQVLPDGGKAVPPEMLKE